MAKDNQGKTAFGQAGQAKKSPETGASIELRQRWLSIWADERPFRKRLLLAAFPSFLLPFILLFFGPLDILITNNTYFDVSYISLLLPCGLITLATFVLLLVFSALMRGRVFDFVLCFLLALSVCLYIQGNFLNLDLGALDGTRIQWELYKKPALLGIVVWAFVFLVAFAVKFLFHRSFPQISLFICVLLLVMQSAALVQDIVTSEKGKNYILTGEDEYVLAGDENIVVFILDGFSNDLMTDIADNYPEELEAFRDFTCFDNYNTGYMGTFPGELHMLTSFNYDFSLKAEENFSKVWSDSLVHDYFNDLNEAGYETRFFTNFPLYLSGKDVTRLSVAASNVVPAIVAVPTETVKQFAFLSLYRYLPQAMKANFWTYSGNLTFGKGDKAIETEDDFISAIRENGIAVGDADKYISYYMLHGPHGPWTVDADGNRPGTETSYEEQGRGYLKACGEYIQLMRDLGIYDDATIIVTADHGSYYEKTDDMGVFTDTQALFLIKEKGANGEAMTYNHAPVSQSDFRSTILYCAGLDYEKYGQSVFDFDEGDLRERSVYIWREDSSLPKLGNYNTMFEYRYTGDNEALVDLIKNSEPITHPLIDSFY